MSDWKQQIEAQIATIDRFPKYLPSGLHTSEITATIRLLLDGVVAAELGERNRVVRGEAADGRLRAALDKLREVSDE